MPEEKELLEMSKGREGGKEQLRLVVYPAQGKGRMQRKRLGRLRRGGGV